MTDEPTSPDTSLIPSLIEPPRDVPDAIERIARIKALQGWLADLEKPVRGWLETKAAEVEESTGSSFRTGKAGIGTVHLTDPQPHPRISDQETFARWYVTAVLDRDPDEQGEDGGHGAETLQFDDRTMRRVVASADPSDLIRFLNDQVAAPEAAAAVLANVIRVDVEWLIGEATLDDMLAGKWQPLDDGKPRLRMVTDRLLVVDAYTGEQVPGVTVVPPASRVLNVTPDPEIKQALRAELRARLGPPALAGD